MQIRRKLTIQFVLLAAMILLLSLLSVYIYSSLYRKMQFGNRLTNRATTNARFFVDVKEFDINTIRLIDRNTASSLPYENIFIFDLNGKLLYCNKLLPYFEIQKEWIEQVKEYGRSYFGVEGYEIAGLHFIGKEKDCIVFAGAIDRDGKERVRNLSLIIIAIFIISIFAVWLSGWVYAGRALAPISGMIAQTDRITVTNLDQRLNVSEKEDELSNLANTINKLLDRLSEASVVQQKFLANAAHELRTPLTVLMGQLEVALMSERSPEYYKKRLASLLNDIVNLKEAANQLLALAQVSADESQIQYTPLNVEDVVLQSYIEVMKRWTTSTVSIHLDESDKNSGRLMVLANEVMIKTALLNLLENACKFGDGKPVTIGIKHDFNMVKIEVNDKGIGIPKEEQEHIFEPFYRGRNTGQIQGSGIGLSVVHKIISLHKGSLQVISQPGRGTTVIVLLPLITDAGYDTLRKNESS